MRSFYSLREKGGQKHSNWKTLQSMKDGESKSLRQSDFDGIFKVPGMIMTGDIDTALAVGTSAVQSEGNFNVRRNGNIIHIQGEVTHSWKDQYDFHKWQPYADGALALSDASRAKKFDFGAEWKQRVVGSVQILSDGSLGNPQFKWTDAPQSD